jgi:predicted metal-dependent phosphotriesterase family hydrolase
MPTVTTTGGAVQAEELGVVLPHEHLLINTVREYRATGLLHDVAQMSEEIRCFTAAGGGTIVDVTAAEIAQGAAPDPLGVLGPPGRPPLPEAPGTRPAANVLALAGLAEATGVHLVLGTGHYRDPYLDRDWFDRHSADQIAELMVRDLEEGFPGTGVRAGIIGEIGAEQWYVSAAEERSFRAAARAHLRTGATITTHAARWPVGLAQLAILTAEGVDPRRVVIGHCDMVPAPEYHLEIAARGAYVQFDTFHRCTDEAALAARVRAIVHLVRAGHLDRVLVSHDVFLTHHLKAAGGTGLSFIPERLPAALREAGLEEAEVSRIITVNPQRAIAG